MGKLLRLYARMLRYRVAIMLLLFFFLGIAVSGQFATFRLVYLWAAAALASSYVAATTVNDISDQQVDRINHPKSVGRPLVTGEATEQDLWKVHVLAVIVCLGFAALIGVPALGILALSLTINYLYSLPPFQLSHRTHFAPLILSLAYVAIPYWLGMTVAEDVISTAHLFFGGGLVALFLGRIILKDFRDREGDATYGKPTFLLRYGKNATCLLSGTAIATGNVLLFSALPFPPAILALLEGFFLAIFVMLVRLWRAEGKENEQVAIGIGAKMGNGLLITVLGLYILFDSEAPANTVLLFTLTLTILSLVNFLFLLTKREYALIGYRG